MMERNSFSVLFFLKKTKLLKNGEASVCMRITVNNIRLKSLMFSFFKGFKCL